MKAIILAALILGGWLVAVDHNADAAQPEGPTLTCRVVNKTQHLCTIHDTGNPEVFRIRYVLNGTFHYQVQYESTVKHQGLDDVMGRTEVSK